MPKGEIDILGFAFKAIQTSMCPASCKNELISRNKKILSLSNIKEKNTITSVIYFNYSTA